MNIYLLVIYIFRRVIQDTKQILNYAYNLIQYKSSKSYKSKNFRVCEGGEERTVEGGLQRLTLSSYEVGKWGVKRDCS